MTVTWVLEYKLDSSKKFQLSPGQDLTLGRDILPEGQKDRKISRQQLYIKATSEDLEVTLSGSNPSCFKRENELPQFVPKTNPVKLHNGDSLFIILDEHEFSIIKHDDEDTIPLPEADLLQKLNSSEINATETIISQFSPSVAKKRKISNISSELDSEATQVESELDNNNENSPPKKQKIEHTANNSNNSPKNAVIKEDPKFDESLIESLLAIVPAITRDIAIRALQNRNGNMELAVNDLLDQYLRNSPVKVKKNIKDNIKNINNSTVDKKVKPDLISINQFKEVYRLNKIKYSQEKDNISIGQLIELVDDVEVAVLTTYKIQMDWLLDQCPSLLTIPEVVIAHGDIVLEALPDNFQLIKPYVPQYGCPHGKIMVLFGKTHLLVMISTGNLIEVDYERKTNGVWCQVFPLKNNNSNADSVMGSDFKLTLYDYILQLGISKAICNRLNKYNFDDVIVRLITSVPGTHSGAQLDKYGHMKLRKELAQHVPQFSDQQIYSQISSIGSIDDKWIQEFSQSCAGGKKSTKLNVIWPSVDFVKNCVDGMDAGGSLCLPGKNLKPAVQNLFQKYQPRQKGRATIPPHIKTFLKFKKNDELEWLCLTSANFSKAAWGVLQKSGTQLTMNNYEIGVLFLPSLLKKSILVGEELNITDNQITLPIPYSIPAPVYNLGEKPWTWDEFPK